MIFRLILLLGAIGLLVAAVHRASTRRQEPLPPPHEEIEDAEFTEE